MSSELKYILIGLHDAGKTTYLAALWYLVQPNRHPTALRIDHLEGSSKYLNAIRTDWLEYKWVPRTFSTSELAVSMRIKEQNSEKKMTLIFPDYAGESFEHQWSEREWTRAYQELLETAAGGLLFVNPDTIKTGLRIDQVDSVLAGIEPEPEEPAADEEQPSGEIPPWDKKESPTQVQLVEVLQFIRDSGVLATRFRLAVIVSAWDRVESMQLTPTEWLKKRLPLLSQFLRTNTATFECEFFGVSAQGGVYVDPRRDTKPPKQVKEPLSTISPVERIKVFGDTVDDAHDITAPLKWLMR